MVYISDAEIVEEKSQSRFVRVSQPLRSDLDNLSQFVSSEVRELLLSKFRNDKKFGLIFQEFADRLYSRSVNGAALMSLDYKGALFISSMPEKKFSQKLWDVIVNELKLPQSGAPFDEGKVAALAKQQSALLENINGANEKLDRLEKGSQDDEIAALKRRFDNILRGTERISNDLKKLAQEQAKSEMAHTMGNGVKLAEPESVEFFCSYLLCFDLI